MGRFANLADIALADLAKLAGTTVAEVEKAGAAAKLADAAHEPLRAAPTIVKRAASKPDISQAEIEQGRRDLNIGWIYKGSAEVEDSTLTGKRTAQGLMLEVPKGHEFETDVLGNFGYAERATKLADGSRIYEHSLHGIVANDGAQKLHIGVNEAGEHFARALEPKDVGIFGPETATERYLAYDDVRKELLRARDVYPTPQTVHVAEDVSFDHVVQVNHDHEIGRIEVRTQDPDEGLMEHWHYTDGKSTNVSHRVVPLEDVNQKLG